MFQHYVLIRNPYARKTVFRCAGTCPHAAADGAVSAFTILSVQGCYPRGCTPEAAPSLLLNADQYARFERDLDEYDHVLNLFFGNQVTISGIVGAIEPRMNRYVPTILNGYLVRLDRAALTDHLRFAELWLYLAADQYESVDIRRGDRVTAVGRFFVNTQEEHRVEIKRIQHLTVEHPFGRWDRLLETARGVAETLRLPTKAGDAVSGWLPGRGTT